METAPDRRSVVAMGFVIDPLSGGKIERGCSPLRVERVQRYCRPRLLSGEYLRSTLIEIVRAGFSSANDLLFCF
jgi:hypothetical protein